MRRWARTTSRGRRRVGSNREPAAGSSLRRSRFRAPDRCPRAIQTLKPDASDNPGTVLANFDINSGKLTSSRTLDLPVKGTSDSLANEADLEGVWWVAADNRIYGATTQNGATTPPTMPEVFAVG